MQCFTVKYIYFRKVMEALEKQMKLLWHTSSIWMNPAIHEYVDKLVQKLPKNLNVYMIL